MSEFITGSELDRFRGQATYTQTVAEIEALRKKVDLHDRIVKAGAAIVSAAIFVGSIVSFVLPYFADKKTVDRALAAIHCQRTTKCRAVTDHEKKIKEIDRKLNFLRRQDRKLYRRARANARRITFLLMKRRAAKKGKDK